MELDFDKYCVVDGSPDTVLPSPQNSSQFERKKSKRKPKCGNDLSSQNKAFADIKFNRYRSASCKSIPSRTILPEGDEVLKRGSVYQSLKEVKNTKKMGDVGGRKKIEFPRSSATAFSFGIIDSLCSSDEDSEELECNRSSLMSLKSELNTSHRKPHNSQVFLNPSIQSSLERGVSLDRRENQSGGNIKSQFGDSKDRGHPVAGPPRDGNRPRERDAAFTLYKSLSAKLALPHSPSHPESHCSNPSSPKSHFSPIRKMLDPFAKSKLLRNSLGSTTKSSDVAPVEKINIRRSKTLQKSRLHEYVNNALDRESDSQFVKKEDNQFPTSCSPAHLHGLLKLKNKHGLPFYEFSVKNPEDFFMAKTWKVGNALNWGYTFHTCHKKTKSNAGGLGSKGSNNTSSLVGQMQVSCFLCAELKDARAFDSIITEFVLYDIAQARKNTAFVHNETLARGEHKSDEISDPTKNKIQPKHVSECGHNPWAPTDLHPNLEIAAIIVEVPFEKRESLKGKRGDQKNDKFPDLHDSPAVLPRPNCLIPAKVNVVTSSGNHSLPTAESTGPSRLLDRWKSGGGCDCGGWDMGCPLVVFGNSDMKSAEDCPAINNQQTWDLYIQGRKEKAPALRMTVTEEGEYEVEFHAQLTALQTFSICVAILHSTEASIAVGQESDKKSLQCDSLRVFVDDDVKNLIEIVTEEEKQKTDKMETPQSFVLNPPFSPIARV